MCGLCGIYSFDGSVIDPETLFKMNNLVKHRGPDDEGYLLINSRTKQIRHCHGDDTTDKIKKSTNHILNDFPANIGFGHRRLSIIDISPDGHQPMQIESGDFWIIFNGEVYNYIELRELLIQRGYSFNTNSDTEVLLYSYLEWGVECVKRFNGMFAFSIWDQTKNRLFCARDRLGIKPFYYYKNNKVFIWASEIKQIVKSGLINPTPHYSNIFNYLMLSRQDLDETTFLNDVVSLPPAHNLIIENGEVIINRYWELNEETTINQLSDDEYAKNFLSILNDSVSKRMRSDVPLGIALSGGLDSGSIAVLAKNLTTNRVKTFSVYYDDDIQFDEREYIQAILETGKFDPVYFTSDEKIKLADIQKMIYHMDEPTASASPFSAYNNYRNIKNSGITVALNGQGGDEILAGYHTYFKYYYLSLLRQFRPFDFIRELGRYLSDHNKGVYFTGNLLIKLFLRLLLPDSMMKIFEKYEKSSTKYFTQELLKHECKISLDSNFTDDLNRNLHQSITTTMLPHLLHYEDRNSMAFSVESRVPLLDHRLVEYMFSVPVNQKIRGSETKYVLRRAMKGILPEIVRNRKDKIGFGTPTDIWTSGQLKSEILDILYSNSFRERGIFNQDLITKNYTNNKDIFKPNEIWKMVSLELWYKMFVDRTD